MNRQRGHIAYAQLRHAGDVVHLRGAAQRVAVAVAHAVALIDKVQVRIEMHYMNRAHAVKGFDHWCVHRMVTAQHQRHRARCQYFANGVLGIGMAFVHIGVHDVGVAHIHDARLVAREVHHIVLVVISASMAKGKQGGSLADGARAKAGTGPPLRAHVIGHADHGDVGINSVPVHAGGGFGEGAMPHKRQIQAAALVGVVRHTKVLSCAWCPWA